MSLGLKSKLAGLFALFVMMSGVTIVSTTSTANAAGNRCALGTWPCFSKKATKKRVARRSYKKSRKTRRKLSKRPKYRTTRYKKKKRHKKKRRTSRYYKARKQRRNRTRKNRYRRTSTRLQLPGSELINLDRHGRTISKKRAKALKRKRRRSRWVDLRRRKKLRHSFKKKKSAYNRGFNLRGRYMRVTSRSVRTNCFPARLRGLIKRVENHYGKRLVVTSGHRSRGHNRRIGGAKRSQHIHCKAVDFRIPGVNKYALARFVKGLPGRGGVGTYCGKSIIHLDVGPRRSWNQSCSKRRGRKRYAKRRRAKRSYRTTSRRSRSMRQHKWTYDF